MLVTLKEILAIAEKEDYAVGAFNTTNLESLMAVIHAAEKLKVPVIIAHAESHESIMPLADIGPIMMLKAEATKVPVCVHLDHGENLDYLQKALNLGFTSIMYDGSRLPYEDNVANTRIAVEMAKKTGASVEAEIGVIGEREAGEETDEKAETLYTDPDIAKKFVDDTGIDALAAVFGTAHGIYLVKPKLDFERIEKIKSLVNIPLVMHGGSGVSPEDYTKAISKGIRKINYYSYMSREGVLATKELLAAKDVILFNDITNAATKAMEVDVMKAMKVFYKVK